MVFGSRPTQQSTQYATLRSQNRSMFLLRKTRQSAWSASRRVRCLVMSRPVAEKSRSDCTDVAGIARYFRARCAHLGYSGACCCHQDSAEPSPQSPDGLTLRYRSNSDTAAAAAVAFTCARRMNFKLSSLSFRRDRLAGGSSDVDWLDSSDDTGSATLSTRVRTCAYAAKRNESQSLYTPKSAYRMSP